MKHFLCLILIWTACVFQSAFAFSFTEELDSLSIYEKEIIGIDAIDRGRSVEIRQALTLILNNSETHLATLDNSITIKRDRLAALQDQPDANDSDKEDAEIAVSSVTLDPILLRNKEELELELISLETEQKKASLVSVYANDLLVLLSQISNQQNQKILFNKAPSLLSISNWRLAYASIPGFIQTISKDILLWVAMVLVIGFALTFLLGPILYRHFQVSYKNLMPTTHYPKWSILLIYCLVLIANCLYFVFVRQDMHIELTFILLMFLNVALAVVLLKRLNDVVFVPRTSVIDGESVVQDRQLFTFFITLTKLLMVVTIIASISGYLILSMYTLHNTVITLTAITLFLSIRALWINSEPKLINELALNKEGQEKGSIFLLTIVELVLAIGFFFFAARFWGVSLNNFQGQSSLLRGEFQIGSLTIELNQLLSSILAFLLVFYFFKLIRWFLRERLFASVKVSVAESEAVVAIIGYIGFTFAILASLNALGIRWENLAIIAGALSVGIGFGLQTIISNFVSGLILLFERPVRVGDWVILGNGLEGHIKKVNMRSTEILTLERSSVLIPNSNLLSDTITNWTLKDNIGRQDIDVGVAYGSNTELVKEVLLGVASEHPKLRRYPVPRVLFKNFGDSSLDLALRFFLININDRHQVGSDLRFAIDKAFRENDITIPFPQRDLHLKSKSFKEE